MKKTIVAASLLLAGGLALSPPAEASYVVTLAQVGSNVVATGSGSINLTGLTFGGSGSGPIGIAPGFGIIVLGNPSTASFDSYTGLTGPAHFGTGNAVLTTSGSGNYVDISGIFSTLRVPRGYVSGGSLSSTATWDHQTFASLRATPGTYVWNWGSAADADSFTLNIGTTAVPEPGSLLLLGTALIGLLAVGRRRCRA